MTVQLFLMQAIRKDKLFSKTAFKVFITFSTLKKIQLLVLSYIKWWYNHFSLNMNNRTVLSFKCDLWIEYKRAFQTPHLYIYAFWFWDRVSTMQPSLALSSQRSDNLWLLSSGINSITTIPLYQVLGFLLQRNTKQSNLREKWFILAYKSRRILFILAGKQGDQSRRLVSDISTAYRKQRENSKWGWVVKFQGPPSSDSLLPARLHHPKGPVGTTSWTPSVQTHEAIGNIAHPNHNIYCGTKLSKINILDNNDTGMTV